MDMYIMSWRSQGIALALQHLRFSWLHITTKLLGHGPCGPNGPMHAYTMKPKLVHWLGVQTL
jgi:hypothetical protein